MKYLAAILTNKNPIQEEVKSTLKSENSVQNILSSSSLFKNIEVKYTEPN